MAKRKKAAATKVPRKKVRRPKVNKALKQQNAQNLADALKSAGKAITPPDGTTFTTIRPEHIATRHVLFQPRTFAYGLYELDYNHVKKLVGRIRNKGELDPITVIKLPGEGFYDQPGAPEWVCVDGHHRLEAYLQAGWEEPIQCAWFGGTVREAVDVSVAANEKIKLEIPQVDRFESAWKRVLLEMGSKADIVKLGLASDGMVGFMRRVKAAFTEKDAQGKELREKLRAPLASVTWAHARMVYVDAEPRELDAHDQAAKLANVMRNKLTDLLSRDPRVTARALVIYDADLASALVKELQAVADETARDEAEGRLYPDEL